MAEAGPELRSWPLPDDITREIFARARYNDPALIVEACCICKDWRDALSDPYFGVRLRAHGALPLPVGFLHASDDDQGLPTFVPTLRSPFLPVNVPDRGEWKALDYRHGRGLFVSRREGGGFGDQELMVWDPVSGLQRSVPVPPQAGNAVNPGAALFCAVTGCDHRPTCNGGTFRIALVYAVAVEVEEEDDVEEGEELEADMRCVLYSSDTNAWAEEASLLVHAMEEFERRPSAVAGHCIYFLSDSLVLLELDLAGHTLTQVVLPEMENWSADNEDSLIRTVDSAGQLGLVESTEGSLFTWLRTLDDEGLATWNMIYRFDHYFTSGTIGMDDQALLGFADRSNNSFFVSTSDGLFNFELPYTQPRDVDDLNVRSINIAANFICVYPVVYQYPPYGPLQQGQPQQNEAQLLLKNLDPDVPAEGGLEEAQAEAALEEEAAQDKKRPSATSDETSSKRLKQEKSVEPGMEQVLGGGQPAVSGGAGVEDDGPMHGQGGPPHAGGPGGPSGAAGAIPGAPAPRV